MCFCYTDSIFFNELFDKIMKSRAKGFCTILANLIEKINIFASSGKYLIKYIIILV